MITKNLTVLAVHGDVDEKAVQSFIDSQYELNMRRPGRTEELPPKETAKCNGLIVAVITAQGTEQEEGRIEIPVTDFAQMEGIKQGGKLRLTIEAVE